MEMIKTAFISTLLGVVFLFHATSHAVGSQCYPAFDNLEENFLVGYGSLMASKSRQVTNPNVIDVYPVMVQNYKRNWGLRVENYHATGLSVIESEGKSFNGVYYPVSFDEITATDERERFYCRQQIAREHLKPLGLKHLPKGKYWIYTLNKEANKTPTKNFPIIQSYVDIFIKGCMEIQSRYLIDDFVDMCIKTTSDWSEHWINDRVYPRRPFDVIPYAKDVDKYLSEHFPDYFEHKYSP